MKAVQHLDQTEQELKLLANRERKAREKWVSFKKKLRQTKGLDPDHTDQRFREEEAKFEAGMKLIDERRSILMAKAPHH